MGSPELTDPGRSDSAGLQTGFTIEMPAWFHELAASLPAALPTVEERMALVHTLARRNFEEGTGGPFAAGVFSAEAGRIVSLGVNRVVEAGCTSAHAEVMALSLAQKQLGVWDLGGFSELRHQLVVNWRPCLMCLGATLWSGVRQLVIAGDGPELEALTGFDEGPVPQDWRQQVERRGIEVLGDVLREAAVKTFADFGASRQLVYNARQADSARTELPALSPEPAP